MSSSSSPTDAQESDPPPDPSTVPRTRTGLYIRARALRALDAAAGAGLINTSVGGQSTTTPTIITNPAVIAAGPSQRATAIPTDSASSISSQDSSLTSSTTSSVRQLGQHLRQKSASFISLSGGDSSPISDRSDGDGIGRRSAAKLNETLRLPRRNMSYIPAYSSRGVNNDEYRKHNLFPLPPPGHIRPILLPTHAVLTSPSSSVTDEGRQAAEQDGQSGDLRLRIDGFVEQWPASVGTGQRLFMQLARQLANLPRLPRQQPAAMGRNRTGTQTPPVYTDSKGIHLAVPPSDSSSAQAQPSLSAPTTPLHADTDDAVFFPEIPYGIQRRASPSPVEDSEGYQNQSDGKPGDSFARHALALGAPERTIGRVLQSMGALPVEGRVEGESWPAQVQETMQHAQHDVEEADETGAQNSTGSRPVGPLGGSPFWANRTKEEVEKLWRTLEHRLRCFWTYRKPFQKVVVEVIPVLRKKEDGQPLSKQLRWVVDEYEMATDVSDEVQPALLAVTDLTSDVNGLFSTNMTVSYTKLRHYFAAYHKDDKKTLDDMTALCMRARMITDAGQTVQTPWQTVNLVHDEPCKVHVICDIDDTAKHTHVLGGARAVARNVFARPFEEVTVPGVQAWFAHLSGQAEGKDSGDKRRSQDERGAEQPLFMTPLISGWHYVTNAPAEMHAITKAYLCAASLPAGALLLKHYFTSKSSGALSWLQAYMQPASARKKSNLLRCLDDFTESKFMLIGDSGEMDLDVYCDLARMRPQQVRAIWIRDVGNVSPLAKALVKIRAESEGGAAEAYQDDSAHGSDRVGRSSRIRGKLHTKRLSRDTGTPGETLTPDENATDNANSGTGNAATEEFLVRLQRNLTSLPDTTAFHFWQTGFDAIEESVRQIAKIKGAEQPTRID